MIGVFDSGYGGLTVLKEMLALLPRYDYLYLGDNARAPYGSRSFDSVYRYTLQGVRHLFESGCPLVILACNTASAKALRNIQQRDLPGIDPTRRVLGVIRPSVEAVGAYTRTKQVGVLGTSGTVQSESYVLEIQKVDPEIRVFQEACPMWVPLVENNEYESSGADYFVEQHIRNILARSSGIDTLILGCTPLPLTHPQDPEVPPCRSPIAQSGPDRCPKPERLLSKTSRNGIAPDPGRQTFFPDHRLPRTFRRSRLRIPAIPRFFAENRIGHVGFRIPNFEFRIPNFWKVCGFATGLRGGSTGSIRCDGKLLLLAKLCLSIVVGQLPSLRSGAASRFFAPPQQSLTLRPSKIPNSQFPIQNFEFRIGNYEF